MRVPVLVRVLVPVPVLVRVRRLLLLVLVPVLVRVRRLLVLVLVPVLVLVLALMRVLVLMPVPTRALLAVSRGAVLPTVACPRPPCRSRRRGRQHGRIRWESKFRHNHLSWRRGARRQRERRPRLPARPRDCVTP